MAKTISQQLAAALLRVSDRRVRQLAKDEGGPEQAASGAFPADAFGRWWERRVLEQHGVTQDGEAYDLNAERARLAKAQADKTELEVSELRGEHVRFSDVTDGWAQHIAAARAKLLSLPSKLAPRVSPPGLVAATQEMIREMVDEALNELAGDGLPERARARRARASRVEGTSKADGKPVGGPRKGAKSGVKRRAGKVDDSEG